MASGEAQRSGAWMRAIDSVMMPAWTVDHPLEIERGEGVYLIDRGGRRYLDAASGYGPTVTGHCHPQVVAACREQLGRLIHTSTTVYTEPVGAAAELLAARTPVADPTVFFLNSGSEAVETAMKLARLATGRPTFIAFRGAFHGRTFGAMALTASKAHYRHYYEPVFPGVYHAPYPYPLRSPYGRDPEACSDACLEELEALFRHIVAPEQVAAIFVEPVLGEGGYVPPPLSFLRGLRRICDRHGILLVSDEIQTGFGRTARWFGIEHAGIEPDILVAAKALASGLPLAAAVARREVAAASPPGTHGGTFGGNPIACAALRATVGVIEGEGLIDRAERLGEQLGAVLASVAERAPHIAEVRRRGLMLGVELVKDRDRTPWPEGAARVIEACRDRGVLLSSCGPLGNVIRLLPPLVTSRDEAAELAQILGEELEALNGFADRAGGR